MHPGKPEKLSSQLATLGLYLLLIGVSFHRIDDDRFIFFAKLLQYWHSIKKNLLLSQGRHPDSDAADLLKKDLNTMTSTPYTGFVSREIIEPTICFTTKKLKINENYPLEKLPISALVKKDDVLVQFTDTDFAETDTRLRRTLTTGVNTYFSEGKNQVLAAVTGYPTIEFCPVQESEMKTLVVSIEPLFMLSKDRMQASIIIKPLLYTIPRLSSETLYSLLTDSGIISGVDYRQLNVVKECLRKKSTKPDSIVLATGKKTIPGANAYLKFELEIGPIPGKLLEDGRIDFRERKIMVPVSAGQVIATKVPATRGQPGMTVLGERVAQRPGQDIKIKTSGDAIYSPEQEKVSATSNGVLSIVQDNVIKVCSKQEINGDIDYSTGNIESRNSVIIYGSVLPGFQVKTDGDLEIRGSVTSTQISSLANIIIKGGIIGNASSVTASGDVDIHFIEQGHISCKGSCIIRKQGYYSHIASGGNIRCRENSVIVGGELIAEGNITLGNAGSCGADPVFIAAGVVAERLYLTRKLEQRLKEHKASIIERLKGHSGIARSKKLQSLKNGIEALQLQCLRINMIPGTRLSSRSPKKPEKSDSVRGEVQNEPTELKHTDISRISIDVHGTIFAGTLLQIGNHTLTVEQTMTRRRFTLDDTKNHILAMPLP